MREESAKLLVADDEPALREALRSSLEFEGYGVETAADGLTALDLLDRAAQNGGPYDAMLLDVMMPRLDGLTACRRLRASGNRVPVLMLTARDAVGDRVSGLDAGADDYLVKPFELDELLARVRALLRRGGRYARNESDGDVLAFGDPSLIEPSHRSVRRSAGSVGHSWSSG
ncbi:response regulator transcription factor [Microbispora sp. CA-135349]|uniref:response regulator transcription factor n=1 Tax=Microbispora sp. CA-135349 TaxID=3239953 RepID=UPI003D9268A4